MVNPVRFRWHIINNNIIGTINLLETMQMCGLRTWFFLRRQQYMGNREPLPITERFSFVGNESVWKNEAYDRGYSEGFVCRR